jgi:hypothetical protein
MTKKQRRLYKLHNALRAARQHIRPAGDGTFDMEANQMTIALVPRINRWVERIKAARS